MIPHNQHKPIVSHAGLDALGPWQTPTGRTGAAGYSRLRFGRFCLPVGLLLQYRFEHSPSRVQDGLRHPCFRQLGTAHIAHHDLLVTIDELTAEPLQRNLAPVRCASMQALRLPLVTLPLRLRNLLLDPSLRTPRQLQVCSRSDRYALDTPVFLTFGAMREAVWQEGLTASL